MLNKINISSERQKLIVYVFLVVVTLAVFWQVNQYDFINFDDNIYVTENGNLKSGITLDGFRWAFSTTYAEFWHPLTWISLMVDNQFYGENAGGYHLTNLVLHILSTLLLFWLFNRMTGAIWKSAFVAALFAIHPLHVESVAWIAKRKDVLSAFFWMLTLCLYVYYTEKPTVKRYLLVFLFFMCALMSKTIVVSLPVIMILLDYWPLSRCRIGIESKKNNMILWQLLEKMPLFILSAVFSIITIYAQYRPSKEHFPLNSRLIYAPFSFMTYLEKIFWPHDMAVIYSFFEQIPTWHLFGSVVLIIIISVAIILAMKRLPYLFVGWLWYAITLLPVIGIIQAGPHIMKDHYIYLPSIGIAIMLAWGVPLLFPGEGIRKKILFFAATAFILVMSVLTWQQCSYWKNSFALWNHTLQVTEDNYFPYHNRGVAYYKIGRYQSAIKDYNEAIRLQPDAASTYINRAAAYANLGQYQLAIEDYDQVIHLKYDSADVYAARGIIYALLGKKELYCQDFYKACNLGKCHSLKEAKNKGYCR